MAEKVAMLGPTKWHSLPMGLDGLDWMGREQSRTGWVEHKDRHGPSHNIVHHFYSGISVDVTQKTKLATPQKNEISSPCQILVMLGHPSYP